MDKQVHWIKIVGSSILVSIACIDPGNLVGDIDVAIEMRYKALWVLFIAHIMLFFFQEMSIDVSAYSGKDIGTHIGLKYNNGVKYFIWISAEIAIIAADIQELLGMSIGFRLMTGISETASLFLSILIVFVVLYLQQISQALIEIVFFIFVGILTLCFMINFIAIKPDFFEILSGFIPNKPESLAFTGVIGSIIMPQNLFFQSSLVNTRSDLKLPPKRLSKIIKIETIGIIIVSFFINMFVVGVFSDIRFAGADITLENVGLNLATLLSSWSAKLWAIGLFFSGLASTTTGALTGQYLMDGIVRLKVNKLTRILITRLLTLIPCILIVVFFNVNRIMGLLNIIQFVQLPFVVIPLLRLVLNRSVMKERKYSTVHVVIISILSALLQMINVYSIYESFKGMSNHPILFVSILVAIQVILMLVVALSIMKKEEKEESKVVFDEVSLI